MPDAVNRGEVGEVALFCDDCGTTHRNDYRGPDYAARLVAARVFLASRGWLITDEQDLCPSCKGAAA